MVNLNVILGVNDIKRHRWFNNFSWDDLIKKKIKPSKKMRGFMWQKLPNNKCVGTYWYEEIPRK